MLHENSPPKFPRPRGVDSLSPATLDCCRGELTFNPPAGAGDDDWTNMGDDEATLLRAPAALGVAVFELLFGVVLLAGLGVVRAEREVPTAGLLGGACELRVC